MTEKTAIKNCPYCGKVPHLEKEGGSHGYFEAKRRFICTCGLCTKWVHDDNDQRGTEEATELWNSKPAAVSGRLDDFTRP